MKKVNYLVAIPLPHKDGIEETFSYQPMFLECKDTVLENAIAFAKEQSYNGEVTIEDDGQEEPANPIERIAALEEQLDMLLSGVTSDE